MIPEDIRKRWSSLWSVGHVPARPWWTGVEVIDPQHPSNAMPSIALFGMLEGVKIKAAKDEGWRTRCDGRRVLKADNGKWVIFGGWEAPNEGERLIMPKMKLLSSSDKLEGLDTEEEATALVDQEYPLPAPEPMPGQVWVRGVNAALITSVDGDSTWWWVRMGGEALAVSFEPSAGQGQWPLEGHILVAGPSQYGRDIPWMKP